MPLTTAATTMKVASTVEHPTDAVTLNNSNSSSSSIDNRSNALSPTEAPLLSAQSSRYAASSIAHMFSISPHDYHLIQEWAWSNRTVLAASSAAVCSVLSGFPFDSVKTRMQTHSYKSIMDCVRRTYAEERLGGFFRGMIPPLITVSIIKSISFSVYEGTKRRVRTEAKPLQGDTIPSLIGLTFISGSVAGTVVALMSSPLELVKLQRQLEKLMAMQTRKESETIVSLTGDTLLRKGLASDSKKMQHHQASATSTAASATKRLAPHGSVPPNSAENGGASSWKTAKAIVQRKGWTGLYSGLNLHVARDCLGTGIYFSSYETIKRLMSETIEHIRPHPAGSDATHDGTTATQTQLKGPGPMVHFLAGGLCGVLSWLVVFPIDLVKSVVQKEVLVAHPRYTSAVDCARDIVRRDGVRGLYRGLSVTCYRAMPIHSLNFLVYEAVMDHVKRWSGHDDDILPAGTR